MQKVFQSRFFILIIGLVLIVGGLLFAVRYTRGALNAYRAMQFAREHDFHTGNLDVDLVLPVHRRVLRTIDAGLMNLPHTTISAFPR